MENTFGRNIIPQNESERLENLKKYKILYTNKEPVFDQLAAATANILDMPVAMINFVDKDNVWTKAGNDGMAGMSIERGTSLCSLAVLRDDVTIFENTEIEPCLILNPVIAGDYGIRFYAAAPISTREGFNIGVVCVMDSKAREFSPKQQQQLEAIARTVEVEIEKRLNSGGN